MANSRKNAAVKVKERNGNANACGNANSPRVNLKGKPKTGKELVEALRANGLIGMWKDRTDFRDSHTLRKLAETRGVKPLANVRKLFNTWPGEPDDGFEENVRRLRREGFSKRHGR